MNNKVVSVVVPVYNVEKYLRKCLDSIVQQTYDNLDIILVDDGSQDQGGKICDEYALEDERIRVLHKHNEGLSQARNDGMKLVKGQYLMFVDSDDFLDLHCIERLLELSESTSSDISICSFVNVDEKGGVVNHPFVNGKKYIFSKEEALYCLLDTRKYSNSAWAKLYKSECFNNIEFPYGKTYEDIPTIYKAFLKADKVAFLAEPLYYYLYRTNSISKSTFKMSRLDALDFVKEMTQNIVEEYPALSGIAKCRVLDEYMSVYESIRKSQYIEVSKEIILIVNKLIREVWFKRECSLLKKYKILRFRIRCILT